MSGGNYMIGTQTTSIDIVVTVNQDDCIRCAACSSVAPEIFRVDEAFAYVVRQPVDRLELGQCETAVANCPTSSIKIAPR